MTKNIIDLIAQDLARLDNEPDLPLNHPKIFTKTGLILDNYAKAKKLPGPTVKKMVRSNSFFKLKKSKIYTGLFKKTEKLVNTIEWEESDNLKKVYLTNPERVIKESTGSKILTLKMIGIINDFKAIEDAPELIQENFVSFEYPQEDRLSLYKKYLPDELDKYQREGKHETDLEKKFRKKVPKGSEFHFSDGKVANNLMSWVQCVQLAPNDVIATHIMNDEFYTWLDEKIKTTELARICTSLKKSVQRDEVGEKEVRVELLNNINKTSLSNIIFETLIQPLLRTLKSDDQSKALDSVDRLVGIGDPRVVEPLMEKVLDSGPQVRRKIIIGLGKIGDKRATPVLLKILKHTTELTDHLLVVKTLGNLKDKRALKTLKNLSKGTDEVGLEAVKVLKNYEGP
jgi:hypothetical protein